MFDDVMEIFILHLDSTVNKFNVKRVTCKNVLHIYIISRFIIDVFDINSKYVCCLFEIYFTLFIFDED